MGERTLGGPLFQRWGLAWGVESDPPAKAMGHKANDGSFVDEVDANDEIEGMTEWRLPALKTWFPGSK